MSKSGEKCVSEALLLRALDEELPPRQAWRVKLHIASCAACQGRAEGLRQISSRIAEMHQIGAPQDAVERFAAALEQESRIVQPAGWWRWMAPPPPLWKAIAWGSALAVMLLVGLRMWTPQPVAPIRRMVPPPAAVASLPRPTQLADLPAPARPARHKRNAGQKQRGQESVAPAASAGAREVTTPFFALPFSDGALPLDQALVIRVDLPGSALELAGLPVEENRRNGRVRADVLLGADGLARAIRFVE